MAADWKQRISSLNWLGIGIAVLLVLELATQVFIGNQPVFALFPYGLIWLLLVGLILFFAYRVYEKPADSEITFLVFAVLLLANICLLIFEGYVQYERENLYYWRSFKDVLKYVLLWFWLKTRREQAILLAPRSEPQSLE